MSATVRVTVNVIVTVPLLATMSVSASPPSIRPPLIVLIVTAELDALGIRMLPRSLGEALDAFKADPLSEKVFGSSMFKAWSDYKADEWASYCNHVSDWEKSRYLKLF